MCLAQSGLLYLPRMVVSVRVHWQVLGVKDRRSMDPSSRCGNLLRPLSSPLSRPQRWMEPSSVGWPAAQPYADQNLRLDGLALFSSALALLASISLARSQWCPG